MTYLVRVEAPHAVFGFEVVDGLVQRPAPIAKWMAGKPGKAMVGYWRRRGAAVTWELVGAEPPVPTETPKAKGKKAVVLA